LSNLSFLTGNALCKHFIYSLLTAALEQLQTVDFNTQYVLTFGTWVLFQKVS